MFTAIIQKRSLAYFQMVKAIAGDILICKECHHQWVSMEDKYWDACPNCLAPSERQFIYNWDQWYKGYVRSLSSKAIREGRIEKKTTCQDCDITPKKIVRHHENYLKPFAITWLCGSCHSNRHRSNHLIWKLYKADQQKESLP